MSKQKTPQSRQEYRLEIGRQHTGRHGLTIYRRTEKKGSDISSAEDLYQMLSKDIDMDVANMTDETLGRIVATIPEVWGRRTIALLKKDHPLEKPSIGFDGPEILRDFAKCAIVGAMWDYLNSIPG